MLTQTEIAELKAAHRVINDFFKLPLRERAAIDRAKDPELKEAGKVIAKYGKQYREMLSVLPAIAPKGCVTTFRI
jgi:hypothetical protein